MRDLGSYFLPWFAASVLGLLLLQGCALAPDKIPPSPPYTEHEIDKALGLIKEQAGLVESFFSSGSIRFMDGTSELNAHALVIGTKRPFRIKIEITHLWGRPLVHFLIGKDSVEMVSFREDRYYKGKIRDLYFTGLLPGRLKGPQLWSFLRGLPPLVSYEEAFSRKGRSITLLGTGGEGKEVLHFDPETDMPWRILFPREGIMLSFTDFEEKGPVKYSREMRLRDKKRGLRLAYNIKEAAFNESIPEAVFELEIPAGFEEVPLGKREQPCPP